MTANNVVALNPNFRTKYRCYVIVHSILSPIQKGIQGAHAMQELAVKYRDYKGDKNIERLYWEWAKNHKTVVFIEGGFSSGIDSWFSTIFHHPFKLPRASFKEDGETLKGLMTSIAIVVPDSLYETATLLREDSMLFVNRPGDFSVGEQDLITKLSRARLAS